MIKYLITTGDSFPKGTELENHLTSRYSYLISKSLNLKEYNFAENHLSNNLISSYTITEILNLISKSKIVPEETLVVISWALLLRNSYYSRYNNRFFISSRKKLKDNEEHRNDYLKHLSAINYKLELNDLYSYFDSHGDDDFELYNSSKHIFLTQCFLEQYKFKYVFLLPVKVILDRLYNFKNSVNADKLRKDLSNNRFQDYKAYYVPDYTQFINNINFDKFFDVYIVDYAEQNNHPIGPGGHPLEKTHIKYSKLLVDFIKQKYEI